MSLPKVELRTDGKKPTLLIDNHLIRGVTEVYMTREVHGPVRVTVELITDDFTSAALVQQGVSIPVADPAELAAREQQLDVLGELRDIDGLLPPEPADPDPCYNCGKPATTEGNDACHGHVVPLCGDCFSNVPVGQIRHRECNCHLYGDGRVGHWDCPHHGRVFPQAAP